MNRSVLLRCAAGAFVAAGLLIPAGQRPALGGPAPLMPLIDVDGKPRALTELSGPRGLVVLFWAGWSERSLEELGQLNAAERELTARGVGVVAVNAEHQNPGPAELAAIRARVATMTLRIPVLLDDGLKLFNAYGVISVPSTALVNPNGELVYFSVGYAPAEREALFDAVDALSGKEKKTASVKLPAVPASALRKLQMGRLELANRRVGAAKATFEALVEAEPSFVEPVVELAAIALDERDVARAEGLLARTLAADHPGAAREKARALFIDGKAGAAEEALMKLSRSGGDDPLVEAYLGLLLAGAGRMADASAAYERARALGGPDPSGFLNEAGDDRVASAIVAYRRAALRTSSSAK